jgi:hypothetical protein
LGQRSRRRSIQQTAAAARSIAAFVFSGREARSIAELFAQTGGVPVPGDASDGALINYLDTGLAGPVLNTAVAWQTT